MTEGLPTTTRRWLLTRGTAGILGLALTGSLLEACSSATPAAQPTSPPAAAPTASGAFPPAVQALVDGAKKEGQINIWTSTPTKDNAKLLMAAFDKRFGLNTKINQIEMSAFNFDTRMFAAQTAGQPM